MKDDLSTQESFNEATELREYDKGRLDEDLKNQLKEEKRRADDVKEQWLQDREEKRDVNVAKRLAQLYEEHSVFEFVPNGATEPYLTHEDALAEAEHSVDKATLDQVKFIDMAHEREIDKAIAVQHERDGQKRDLPAARDFGDAAGGRSLT